MLSPFYHPGSSFLDLSQVISPISSPSGTKKLNTVCVIQNQLNYVNDPRTVTVDTCQAGGMLSLLTLSGADAAVTHSSVTASYIVSLALPLPLDSIYCHSLKPSGPRLNHVCDTH